MNLKDTLIAAITGAVAILAIVWVVGWWTKEFDLRTEIVVMMASAAGLVLLLLGIALANSGTQTGARKRRVVFFTGITRFMSGADRLVSRIPGVQHAGAGLVGIKSMVQNRGSKARAKEILETWLGILNGSTSVRDLP